MICKNLDISSSFDGRLRLTVELTNKSDAGTLENMQDELLDVTIKKHRNKRSLSQNSYLWVIFDKLAAKLNATKEEIYQHAIRQVGKFEIIPIRNEAVEAFLSAWQGQGLGNVADVVRDSTMDGYKVIHAYYGSSTYCSADMSRLIDYVIEEAKQQGIDVMTKTEIERLRL